MSSGRYGRRALIGLVSLTSLALEASAGDEDLCGFPVVPPPRFHFQEQPAVWSGRPGTFVAHSELTYYGYHYDLYSMDSDSTAALVGPLSTDFVRLPSWLVVSGSDREVVALWTDQDIESQYSVSIARYLPGTGEIEPGRVLFADNETNAGIVRLGETYIVALVSFQDLSNRTVSFARSSDGGVTWKQFSNLDDPLAFGTRPRLVTVGGDLFCLMVADLSGEEIPPTSLYRSKDNGASWTAVLRLAYPDVDDRWSRLAASEKSLIVATTVDVRPRLYVSRDRGDTWLDPIRVSPFAWGVFKLPEVEIDLEDRWHLFFTDISSARYGAEGDLMHTVSADEGQTWSKVDTLNCPGQFGVRTDFHIRSSDTSIRTAVNDAGDVLAAWQHDGIHGLKTFLSVARSAARPPAPALRIAPVQNPSSRSGGSEARLRLPRRMETRCRIYDVDGREVASWRTPVAGPGTIILRWDGRATRGREVGPGVYFWMIEDTSGASGGAAMRVVLL